MKTKKLTFLLALTFLFLFSCGTIPKGKYVQENTTEQDFSRDYADCKSLTRKIGERVVGTAFHHCLIGKGWVYVDEKGNPVEIYKINQ